MHAKTRTLLSRGLRLDGILSRYSSVRPCRQKPTPGGPASNGVVSTMTHVAESVLLLIAVVGLAGGVWNRIKLTKGLASGSSNTLASRDSGGGARDVSPRERAETQRRERELRETLDQVATLAMRARPLLSGREPQRTPGQGSLGFEDTEGRESSTSRSRRSKRD